VSTAPGTSKLWAVGSVMMRLLAGC
jgi:hypothetical protein